MSTAWIQRAADNFNRANEDPLSNGGVWSNLSPLAGMKVVGNQALSPPVAATYYGSYHHGYPFPPNQYSQFTHGISGLIDYHSRAVRTNQGLAGFHGYIAQLDFGTPTTYYIQTFVNGAMINTVTLLGRPNRQTFPTQRLVAVGNRIALEYLTGGFFVEHSFITDNNIPSGWPGIVSYRSGATNYPIDDWSAGDDGVPAPYTGPNIVAIDAGPGEYFSLNKSAYYFPGINFLIHFPSALAVPIYIGGYDANAGGGYTRCFAQNAQYEILSMTQIRLSFFAEYRANTTWNHGSMFCTGIPILGVPAGNLSNAWDVPIGQTRTYYRMGYFQILVDVDVTLTGLLPPGRRRHRGGELWDIVPEVAPYLG